MIKAVLIPILVILVSALVTSLLYRERQKRNRFNAAAEAFQSAFLPAITKLNTRPGSHRNILDEEFGRHRNAAIAFRQHIHGRHLAGFDKAWQAYEAYVNEQTDVPLTFFLFTEVTDMDRCNDPDHIREVAEMRKKECLDHINSLLKFAKLK